MIAASMITLALSRGGSILATRLLTATLVGAAKRAGSRNFEAVLVLVWSCI